MTDRYKIAPCAIAGLCSIVDSHAGKEVVAYAPFASAEQVRLALEVLGEARAGLARRNAAGRDVIAAHTIAVAQDVMASHPLTDLQTISSPNASPLDRMIAHGRHAWENR